MDKKSETKLMELRNTCLYDFHEGDELVQMSYLVPVDFSGDIEGLMLEKIGGVREIGMATVGHFMKIGITPVSILYEKDGRTVRNLENGADEFCCVHGNIYRGCRKKKAA